MIDSIPISRKKAKGNDKNNPGTIRFQILNKLHIIFLYMYIHNREIMITVMHG